MTSTNQSTATADKQQDGSLDENTMQGDQANPGDSADISKAELDLLDKAGTPEDDRSGDDPLLDNTDEDGEELNEADDLSGDDLDVPGSESDDEDEALGEEDEENNSYSQADQEDGDEDDSQS